MSLPLRPTTLHTHPQPQPSPGTITITTPRLLLRAAHPTDAPALHAVFSNADVMRYWDTLPHTSLAQTSAWLGKILASPANGVTEFVVCLRCPLAGAAAALTSSAASSCSSSSAPRSTSNPTDSASSEGPSSSGLLPEVIGKVGIWRETEIGFLLHRAYWRQGLMREALEALLPYYFAPVEEDVEDEDRLGSWRGRRRGAEVVTADTDPRNSACIDFLTGFGFEVTGREERTFQIGPYGGGAEGDTGGGSGGGGGGEWVDSVYLALRREAWLERRQGLKARGA